MIWEGPVVRTNFTCNGDEDCLSMCQSDEQVGICQKFAAVTCHGTATYVYTYSEPLKGPSKLRTQYS